MEHRDEPRNIVNSIVKASTLLECFTTDRREMSLAEFAAQTDLNKTTIYRILQTLVRIELLTRTPSGGYKLGMKILHLAAIVSVDLDVRHEALPIMKTLVAEFGDTAFLMVPEEDGAVIIETVIGRNPVGIQGVPVGTTLPYHVAAGPIVLAAFDSATELRVLKRTRARLTPHTETDASMLRDRFRLAREHGYVLSRGDYIEEVSAVAAPVMNAEGLPIAALSLGGPASRFNDPKLCQSMTERIVEAAAQLSARMGFTRTSAPRGSA